MRTNIEQKPGNFLAKMDSDRARGPAAGGTASTRGASIHVAKEGGRLRARLLGLDGRVGGLLRLALPQHDVAGGVRQ